MTHPDPAAAAGNAPIDEIEKLLRAAGLWNITAASSIAVVEDALRRLAASLDGANPFRVNAVRIAALRVMASAKVRPAARLFDAALAARRAETNAAHAAPSADDENGTSGLPLVIVGHDDVVTVDAAEEILAAAQVGFYQQAGRLVRVAQGRDATSALLRNLIDPEAPIVAPVPLPSLREQLSARAEWCKLVKRDGKFVHSRIHPPVRIAEMLAARGEWMHFPLLRGVIEAPTLLSDGRLIEAPGFDKESGLFLRPSAEFPPVPAQPTREDAVAALARLAEPLCDFPFARPCHKSAALATMILGVARWSVPGPCPMSFVGSPTRGTGKGKLAKVLLIPMLGRIPAMSFEIRSPTETRKSIFSLALSGGRYVLVDNVTEAFGDAVWAALLTADTVEDRILQVSERGSASLRGMVFVATGNNPSFKGDSARRILMIEIDAGVEQPEERVDFRYANVEAHVLSIRPQLVVDALTILRAFHLAGSPRHGGPRIGSFEEWDDRIRSALIWAGADDPAESREQVRDSGDEDVAAIRAVLDALDAEFPGGTFTSKDVAAAAKENESLASAFEALSGVEPAKLRSHAIGLALKRINRRVLDGRRVESAVDEKGKPKLSGGVAIWRVVEVAP